MMAVDQRWMAGGRRFNGVLAASNSQAVEANGDQLDALVMKFISQYSPHGQVIGTASVRRPSVKNHLLAQIV
jgi:porphobilinogen deaminase